MMGNNLFDGAEASHLVVLRSGAFISNQLTYIPSADGLFEHGTCYSLATRQAGNVERCRSGYKGA
ncbi:hypothetical protein [Paenibacillus sp. CAA11]|uniref:hypothetical protein n=1 Tax=Paenibacillus sp. CAA11 TaxID=1532905 RepID=UPI00131F1C92|nr:hypothetical protein [Paenibacillus sp. CAA11]